LAAEQDFREVAELAPGEEIRLGSVTIRAVPAQHDGRREPLGPSLGAVGYVVSGRSSVYFAGDTDLFDRMREIGPRLDAALLPVWGWGPTVGPGHLDPEGAARALALLRPRIAIPVHWGTLFPVGLSRLRPKPLREPPLLFADHAAQLAPDVEVRILAPGESTMISRPAPLPSGRSA
jgi:L-ascorbate metabolism protein UlaG (beta-lactamase superfamily)